MKSILEGKFNLGQKLPGIRILAAKLNISRYNIILALEQLLLEGCINGKVGAGAYVNEIPDNFLNTKEKEIEKNQKKNKHKFNKSTLTSINLILSGFFMSLLV